MSLVLQELKAFGAMKVRNRDNPDKFFVLRKVCQNKWDFRNIVLSCPLLLKCSFNGNEMEKNKN